LIDCNRWRGAFYGMFQYSLKEMDEYWTYDDVVDFEIACDIKKLMELK
jgi:hypothetical protein